MNLNIAICDDEQKDIDRLKEILLKCSFSMDIDISIDTFINSSAILSSVENKTAYHLLFLDIEMPGLNGIEIAAQIRRTIPSYSKIVFVSSYPEYMCDSFSVHPYHFLQKPVSQKTLENLLSDIREEYEIDSALVALLDDTNVENMIYVRDIYCIEVVDAKAQRICFYLKNRHLHTKGTLISWAKKLEGHDFEEVSRSMLINLFHIHYFEGDNLFLENGKCVHISRRNKKRIMDKYLNHVVSRRKKI